MTDVTGPVADPRHRRRRASRLGLIALVALLVGGCGGSEVASPATSHGPVPTSPAASAAPIEPSPSSASARPALRPAGALAWRPEGDFETATLSVPLDDRDPAVGSVDLALIRQRARDPAKRIGMLLVNPGGPGGSGVDMVRFGGTGLPDPVLDAFDIIGFDPRGIGESEPLDCPPPATIMKLEGLDPSPDTKAGVDENLATWTSVADACERTEARLLPFVSTDTVARDMDRIRAALGEDTISYHGYSYGTYLGARYATLFPQRLRAAVLDGAVDPTIDRLAFNEAQARGFEAALDQFLADCGHDPDCPFHGGDDPAAAFDALIARIAKAPIPTRGRVPLGPGEAMSGVFSTLYWRDRSALALALAAAEGGDGTDLLGFADAYWMPDSPWSVSAYAAVGCLDRPGPADVKPWEALYDKLRTETPRVGAWVGFELTCVHWPVRAPLPPPVAPAGQPPILVIGTTGDPATPYPATAALATALGSGIVVTHDGVGHTAAPYDDCLRAIIEAYYLDLVLPAAGATCADPPIDLSP